MQKKFKQSDIEDYVISQINGLQEILSQYHYPNLANFIKLIKTEFMWQSKLAAYLAKDKSFPRPVVIDITDTKRTFK